MHPQGWNAVKDPALSAARGAGLHLIAAGLAGSAAHPAYPGSVQTRRRAISAASPASSNADMPSHRRNFRPVNGCTPERSGRVSRRAAGFARVGGSCRPPAKSQTGLTASRSVCGVTENTALWRASVSAANQCAPSASALYPASNQLARSRTFWPPAIKTGRPRPPAGLVAQPCERGRASARGGEKSNGSDNLERTNSARSRQVRHPRSILLGRHGRTRRDRHLLHR
jgi:hypothetical protein